MNINLYLKVSYVCHIWNFNISPGIDVICATCFMHKLMIVNTYKSYLCQRVSSTSMKGINTWNNLEYSSAGFRSTIIMLQNPDVYIHSYFILILHVSAPKKLKTKHTVNVKMPTTFNPHGLELTK
jgi:hypothetical protein